MSMRPKLWGLSALAIEIGRDRRTIAKALQHTRPDGRTAKGDDAWFMTTAMRALGNGNGRRSFGDDDFAELEHLADKLQRCYEAVAAEKSVDRRRIMVRDEFAPMIKRVDAALEEVCDSEEARIVLTPFRHTLVATMISEARLSDCKLHDTPDGVRLVVP
jgi:hypothetical protein